jgi:predicted TIM-barrel fold metal-dependent hydrolase
MTITVDLHNHVIPDFYWEASNEGGKAAGGITPPPWSLDGMVAYMDEARIDLALPSISTPGVHLGDDAAAADLARRCNEYLADLDRKYPGRFGGWAALPVPAIDAALAELAYAMDTLGLDGVCLMTNVHGNYLGEPVYDELFAEMNRRGTVVFVHPNDSPDGVSHRLAPPESLLDYPVDTSRAIAQLLYTNTFARFPEIKFIFSHGGGTVPYLATRFGVVDAMGVVPGAEERGTAAAAFKRLYWDTAIAFGDNTLCTLRQVAGMSQIVFGTDYPYPRNDLTIGGRRSIDETAVLEDSEREAIFSGNAAALLPRVARLAGKASGQGLS